MNIVMIVFLSHTLLYSRFFFYFIQNLSITHALSSKIRTSAPLHELCSKLSQLDKFINVCH